ncbi:MAG: energy transducer TonB [Candidatus Acidiferrales bacterium]
MADMEQDQDFSSRPDNTGRSETEPTLRIGRFPAPSRGSFFSSLISNLKDFLTERPVKLRPGQETWFNMQRFGDDFRENLSELFKPTPKAVNSELLIGWTEHSFLQNLRDTFFPKKLPPLQVTSKPVPVKDIWSKDTQFTRVQALSVTMHVGLLLLIIFPLLMEIPSPATTKASDMNVTQLDVSPYLPRLKPAAKRAGGGGGGGHHELLPASKGVAPKFSWDQITPAMVKTPPHPLYAMQPTVLGPPQLKIPQPNMNNWGDPLQKVLNDSSGSGGGGGIGSGNNGGVGSGTGGGLGPGSGGSTGGGVFNAGTGGYGYPACLYCPQAQYSDEAVKAKYQGTVELLAVITPDGRATEIQVLKGVGLGLDQKAIEAVRTWRFSPALGPNGKPAPVRQIIEVTFHLY